MPDTVFLDALQKITAGPLSLRELIEAAMVLNSAGQSQPVPPALPAVDPAQS